MRWRCSRPVEYFARPASWSVRPEKPEDLAVGDLERDPAHRLDTAWERLTQIATFQYRHARQSNVPADTTRKVRHMRGGIDLGGTKIQAVVVDGRSKVLG